MKFAKLVFLIATIYGVIALFPQYFLEREVGRQTPPPITHPEFYYGFIGVALAGQIFFFIISRDPVRYRPLMIAAILEKASFGIAMIVLYALGRISIMMLSAGSIDLIFGVFFVAAYLRTRGIQ
jgi:hypothetical protein